MGIPPYCFTPEKLSEGNKQMYFKMAHLFSSPGGGLTVCFSQSLFEAVLPVCSLVWVLLVVSIRTGAVTASSAALVLGWSECFLLP